MQKVKSLDEMIKLIGKLPGLGPRSARRIALHLLKNTEKLMKPLSEAINLTSEEVVKCKKCGNLDSQNPCYICVDENRDRSTLCVVEDIDDLWAIERGSYYKGIYHVIGGNLSALDGRTPENLNLDSIAGRVKAEEIVEVIIATSATLEGQNTGFYISDLIKPLDVKSSRLAHGIPVGAELDYMDEGTLAMAMKMRTDF